MSLGSILLTFATVGSIVNLFTNGFIQGFNDKPFWFWSMIVNGAAAMGNYLNDDMGWAGFGAFFVGLSYYFWRKSGGGGGWRKKITAAAKKIPRPKIVRIRLNIPIPEGA